MGLCGNKRRSKLGCCRAEKLTWVKMNLKLRRELNRLSYYKVHEWCEGPKKQKDYHDSSPGNRLILRFVILTCRRYDY